MYLAFLNEDQKRLFLQFAYHIASADGNYSTEEKMMMDSYCDEMEIEHDFDIPEQSVDEIIRQIALACSKREKQIMIFEAIGLAMADHSYDSNERSIIQTAIGEFGIPKSFSHACEQFLQEYLRFQEKINEIVLE